MLRFVSSLLVAAFRALGSRLPLLRGVTSRLLGDVVRFPADRKIVLGKLLAEGGFSFVYLGSELGSGQEFALKKMISQDVDAKTASRREVEMHERFNHPNLLALVDKSFQQHPSNRTWEICWLLLPLCKTSLREEITRQVLLDDKPGAAWTQANVMEILQGICSGLQEMHRHNIAHRDLKPENVLLRDANRVPVLMDFGSCGSTEVRIKDRREAAMQVEVAAQFCTMQYRAPELFDVPSDIGSLSYALADVWSLGCTGYCCLMGYSPFEVEFETAPPCRPRQVDTTHLRILGSIPWPKSGPRSGTPEWLKDLLRWTLANDHKLRPNVGEVFNRVRGVPQADSDSV